MSIGKAAALIVVGLVLVAGVIIVVAPEMRNELPAVAKPSTPPDGKGWLAVAPGRIEPRSGLIKIAAPMAGLVDAVLVKANDTVFAGEPLVQLRDDELKARLTAAESQVALRRRVRNEQPATGRAEERRNAEDAVANAEKAVFDAQAAVDRAAAQWRTSGEPDQSLTEARAALAKARQDLRAGHEQLRKFDKNGPLPTPVEAQLSSALAQLSAARAALEKMTIRAPIDGTVLQVNVEAGELATPSAPRPLVLLANLTALRVRAELDERDVTDIKVGHTVSVRAAAFPGRDFTGKVAFIAPLVEPARLGTHGPGNRTDVDAVEVMVDLAQPGPLAVGMKADVYFDQAGAAR